MPSERIEMEVRRAKAVILQMITDTLNRLTPGEIQAVLRRDHQIDKKVLSRALLELVSERTLTYTNLFGCTFLELSFSKPVQVSERIVLKPPEVSYPRSEGVILIDISPGAAFGSGEHPTTRLCLRGMEHVFSEWSPGAGSRMLDVGTGSGILAIAGLLMGACHCIAADIDPCARAETLKNAAINGLSGRIEVMSAIPEPITDRFSLITANLRTPTLKTLNSLLKSCLGAGGAIVLSGLKKDEIPDIKEAYEEDHLLCRWEECEKGWAGLAFYSSP